MLSHLDNLESEGIYIIREVVATARKPVMLYSIKERLISDVKASTKGYRRMPFPLLHIDTKWKFREMIFFRDKVVKDLNLDLLVHTNPDGLTDQISQVIHGSKIHTEVMKTQALKQALNLHGFDAAFGGARDEEKSRAKERIFPLEPKIINGIPRDKNLSYGTSITI